MHQNASVHAEGPLCRRAPLRRAFPADGKPERVGISPGSMARQELEIEIVEGSRIAGTSFELTLKNAAEAVADARRLVT